MWYVQTDEGEHFGPVPRNELDDWVAEGRIDEKCQLLRGDWEQWQWADTEYPELADAKEGGEVHEEARPRERVVNEPIPTLEPGTSSIGAPDIPADKPNAAGSGSGSGSGIAIVPRLAADSSSQPPPAPPTTSTKSQYVAKQRQAMQQTAPWVGLISRLGMAASGLMGVAVVFLAFLGVTTSNASVLFLCIVYLAIGFFFAFVPAWMLYGYFRAIRQFLHDKSAKSLTIALMTQQRFWYYMGIAYIVGFCLSLVFGGMTLFMGQTLLRMLIPTQS